MTDNQNTNSAAQSASEKTSAVNAEVTGDQKSSSQLIKETANNVVGQAKNKATGLLGDQKSKAVSGLSEVADSIRKVGENLRNVQEQTAVTQTTVRYTNTIAKKIEGLSSYLEDVTLKDLTRDVETFARQQPALFVGGAFLVGVLAARFLKTSAPNSNSTASRNT